MTRRRRFTAKQKASVCARQSGLCAECGQQLTCPRAVCEARGCLAAQGYVNPSEYRPGDPTEFDHERPLALLGEDTLLDLRAIHASCHIEKTKADVARIAKAKRQEAFYKTGRSRKRKGPPIKSRGFRKDVTRKLDGTVVPRERR